MRWNETGWVYFGRYGDGRASRCQMLRGCFPLILLLILLYHGTLVSEIYATYWILQDISPGYLVILYDGGFSQIV